MPKPTASSASPAATASGGFHSFTLTANDGTPHPLAQYRGKVVLVVNTASKCGNTPQYAGLQKLFTDKNAQGFVVLAVPANEFGKQEPGSNADILNFCTATYHVTFPLMAKTVVKGASIDPLYAYLTTQSPFPGAVTWNFAKFLIGRDGTVVGRFDPKTKPDDANLVKAIETALAAAP